MRKRIKAVVQYAIILALTVFLVWFSLGSLRHDDVPWYESLYEAWLHVDKGWLLATAAVAMASHIIRAIRWNMLLESSGNPVSLSAGFVSLMVGYLVNLVIPRGGEISRCYNLYRINGTPVDVSFGTVVTERLLDVICLLLLLLLAFAVEADKILLFIDSLPTAASLNGRLAVIFSVLAGLGLVLFAGYLLVKRNERVSKAVKKAIRGFKQGLGSVLAVRRKGRLVFHSILIWGLYFIMTYTVILAFPETESLGPGAVLTLFAIGAIAMAMPLPGGTGAYHTLVPAGLTLIYSLPQKDAVVFTFVFHGWQTLIMIVGGGASLIATAYLVAKKNRRRQN